MKFYKRIAFLITICIFSLTAFANASTYASAQITSYAINAGSSSNGEIFVDFAITGAGLMKKIGAERIAIYERTSSGWESVVTYQEDDDGMSTYDDYIFGNSIYYPAVSGVEYQVIVTVFAEDYGGGFDSRTRFFTFTAK